MTPTRIQTLALTRRLYLGDLRTPITISIQLDEENDRFSVSVSHEIKTPPQDEPYVPAVSRYEKNAEEIFEAMVVGYRQMYSWGEENGDSPSESWLVPV